MYKTVFPPGIEPRDDPPLTESFTSPSNDVLPIILCNSLSSSLSSFFNSQFFRYTINKLEDQLNNHNNNNDDNLDDNSNTKEYLLYERIMNRMKRESNIDHLSKMSEFFRLRNINLSSKFLQGYQINQKNICPQSILLTGATGFLGSFLFWELFTSTTALLHLVVRDNNNNDGDNNENDKEKSEEERGLEILLRALLKFQIIDKNDNDVIDRIRKRVKIFIGDISKPLLQLSLDNWKYLCKIIDVIYHNAALVNSIMTYQQMKPANVTSTKILLKLATHSKLKVISYYY